MQVKHEHSSYDEDASSVTPTHEAHISRRGNGGLSGAQKDIRKSDPCHEQTCASGP